MDRKPVVRVIVALAALALAAAGGAPAVAAPPSAATVAYPPSTAGDGDSTGLGHSRQVRGWTILSDSDAGADEVIAAAPAYRINHLQISHEIVHDLREVRDPVKQAQANRLTDAAHRAGIAEVAIWDHALYSLTYYPAEFRTGPGGTIDLDNPDFWAWFKQDYREMLDLLPNNDAVVLTFIETGARVERQHSVRLTTDAQKLAYLVDQVASVVVDERRQNLYLRTFGYTPQEIVRTVDAIALVQNPDVRVMAKAQPHDFFLTHPNDRWVQTINRPTIIEFDTAGEYNGQGKMANAWPEEHVKRWRYYERLPNVIGYTARTDRYGESRIVGTPTEINLYALYRASANRWTTPELISWEWAIRTYGWRAAPSVRRALGRSFDIVTSSLYTLGSNSANHSRLDYDPYCSSWHRSVSGKWIDPPVTFVRHDVNRRFHFWIDTVDHLAPPLCKTDPTFRRESGYVLDNGWVKPGSNMTREYLDLVVREKVWSVRQAEAARADIERARRFLSAADYQQLRVYFDRTLLTVKLHRWVSQAYFGYRLWAQDAAHQTPHMQQLIWAGLRESQQLAAQVRAFPEGAPTGEWNWVVDADQADLYYNRIANGWDRYGNVKVPPPA